MAQLHIVIFLVGEWGTFHRRPMLEALARNLGEKGKLMVVNPIQGLRAWPRLWAACDSIWPVPYRRLDENLSLLAPWIWFPGAGRRGLSSRLTRAIVSSQVRGMLRHLGRKDGDVVVAWVYRPEQIACVGLAGEQVVVYECYDEYRLSSVNGRRLPEVERLEKALLQHADIVFTTARSLFESRAKEHKSVHYAPNGVDFDLFNQAVDGTLPLPDEFNAIPTPRLGYIGNISAGLDFDILESLAAAGERWSLVLVGPIEEGVRAQVKVLKQRPNVHFLGWRDRRVLPRYLRGLDVGIIPFKAHGYNYERNPLKLWEYLAAGRPVVCLRVAEAESLDGTIWLADDAYAFVAATREALGGSVADRVARGIEIAREHSWSCLTYEMLRVVRDCCTRKGLATHDSYAPGRQTRE